MCVCVVFPFILDVRLSLVDVPAAGSHRRKVTDRISHPPAVLTLIFLARRIQPFLSLVDWVKSNSVY